MTQALCESTVMANMWFGLLTFSKAGDGVDEHEHMFDHVTLLAHGTFEVVKYDEDKKVEFKEVLESPCLIYIEKNKRHSIVARTDGAIACCNHAIYESEKDLFPLDIGKVPIVGGSLKLSLLANPEI